MADVAVVPLRLGRRPVPVVELFVRHKRGGSLREYALVDSGSAFLIFSEAILRSNHFPTRTAERTPRGIEGISGRTSLWRLDDCAVSLVDRQGAQHWINAPIFFTREKHVPILGRETLRAFNAKLELDFVTLAGTLDLG